VVRRQNAARVVGSFDVTASGVHLAGDFDAVTCQPDGGFAGVGALDGCQP
jgi:hypothetical protein